MDSLDLAGLGINGGVVRFPVEDYLEARGRAFASVFDAESFLSLSTSIDLHYVEPGLLETRTSLVSFDTDALVPPWLVEELAQGAPGVCEHVTLSSPFGHDAFLIEIDRLEEMVQPFLDQAHVAVRAAGGTSPETE